jgi:phage-related protein
MGVASGIGHLFQSAVEVIQGIFAAIFNAFALVLHTIADIGKGAVHFIEGTLGFAIRKLYQAYTMEYVAGIARVRC